MLREELDLGPKQDVPTGLVDKIKNANINDTVVNPSDVGPERVDVTPRMKYLVSYDPEA